MEIEARRARGGRTYWLRSLLAELLGASVGADRDAPTVLVRQGLEERVLLRTGTYGQAVRAQRRFSAEQVELGDGEFARRYGIVWRAAGN